MICELIASLVLVGMHPTGPVYGPVSQSHSFFEEAKDAADCERRLRVYAGEMCPYDFLYFEPASASSGGGHHARCENREWEGGSFQRRALFLRSRLPVPAEAEEE